MYNYSLLSLLQLSDSTLPIGGYAHSNSLETYVQCGVVKDVVSAKAFVTAMLSQNLHYTDAAFVSLAYDAAQQDDLQKLLHLDDECSAVKLPREIRQASQKLGMRLLKIFQPITGCAFAARYLEKIPKHAVGHYCIVFGIYAAVMRIPKEDALTGFYYNAATGMVTNSVKLIPLSQHHGQEILFSLQSLIAQLVGESLNPNLQLIGRCCAGFDIRSMQHEQLYSRLYMS